MIARGPKDWEAQSDAEALLRAEEVKEDPKRLKAARKWLKDMTESARARAEGGEAILSSAAYRRSAADQKAAAEKKA